ncbi:MAG: hypothetical protein MJ137_00830 [Clostridia bacterium]|nr:hypothetical protein [Clostridia bacterium]
MTIAFINRGMNPDAFGLLLHAAVRHLYAKKIKTAEAGADGDYTVCLSVDGTLKDERYIIRNETGRTVISGQDELTLIAGFGRFFSESFFDGLGGFEPPVGDIDFTPDSHLRGMYFATHFYNFYHNAPLYRVYEVIEDLALYGCNSLLVWFDMHHYSSMEDEGAQDLVKRLRAIIKYANRLGIPGSLTMLSNEGFASSPVGLRAEWDVKGRYYALPDGHYHVELCPSKEGGIEEILRERRMMLEKFADLDIRYVTYWPYDQGGCTCAACEPWGAGGFLKLLPHFAGLISEIFPRAKIILSTWYFDKFCRDEWRDFYPHLTDGSLTNVEYVMAFFFEGVKPAVIEENGIPEGIEFIDFPEISMYSCRPWGGFGASVLARFLGKSNSQTEGLYKGGFPYSEGIFEDVNKYICLCNYSGLYRDPADAVRAYVRTWFSVRGEALDELTDAVLRTETALSREQEVLDLNTQFDAIGAGEKKSGPKRYRIDDVSDIDYVFGVFEKYNKILPESITSDYRFRLYYLRAQMDKELKEHDFTPSLSEKCQEIFAELRRIYYACDKTSRALNPPLGQ